MSVERDRSKMYIGLRGKYQLFLTDFKENWIFSTDIHVTNVMKISSLGTKSSHADRQTDRQDRHDEAISRFSQFYERA